jgi:hypothetical protein
MLIEELIERAFCDGYEYAQREFGKGSIRMLKKTAKNVIRGEHAFQNGGMNAVKSTSAYKSLNRSIPGGVQGTESFMERNASKITNQRKINSLKSGLEKFDNKIGHGNPVW